MTSADCGSWPTATNVPDTGISRSSPVSRVDQRGVAERAVLAGDELAHAVGRQELDVRLRPRALEHDLRGAELVAAVHHRHLGGELGQEDRLLHRRVAAADDDRLGLAEERGIAGGAVADAAAGELLLAGDAQLLVLGAHRQHDRARAVLGIADPHAVHAARLARELDAIGLVGDQPRAEALGLVAELLHHLRAHHAVGEAGVVLHVGRLLQQAAPGEALDHQRAQVRARGVQRRRVPGRAAADDDHVLDVAHLVSWSPVATISRAALLCKV